MRLGQTAGLKMPQPHPNWVSPSDIENLLALTGFERVRSDRRMIVPHWIPLVSHCLNRYVAPLPGIHTLCLVNLVIVRMRPEPEPATLTSTIVIPTRNERGNIAAAVARTPPFGGRQEIIFVDGHSTDGTPEEIQRVIAANPDRDIKFLKQTGKGKGDAVRLGFAQAQGEVLMILDADLTMPPEDLPKFYDALASGKGEFINGTRLVYPMEGQAMRYLNLLGNKFFSLALSWLLNQRIKDTLCGTKVLRRESYARIVANRAYFGEFDPFGDFDLIFGAARQNLRIVEVPIRYRDRAYGSTNISRFRHGWLLLRMTVFAFRKIKAG
jgi:glycosyltransferase involved in cell wall biosynthesis